MTGTDDHGAHAREPIPRGRRLLRARRAQVVRLRAVALENAARGWYVFPLSPGGKIPIFHGGDRCRRRGVCRDGHQGWQERATRDEDQIRAWWGGAKPWNVGIACGPSGLLVIDLDLDPAPARDPGDETRAAAAQSGSAPRRDGAAELARIAADHDAIIPATFCVSTPSVINGTPDRCQQRPPQAPSATISVAESTLSMGTQRRDVMIPMDGLVRGCFVTAAAGGR